MTITKAMARIKGADRDELEKALTDELGEPYFWKDEVVIFAAEKFYRRTNSNLMRVVIASFTAPSRCDIGVMAGGGGTGVLGISWGSEDSDVVAMMSEFWKVCRSKGWQYFRVDDTGKEIPL
jgi:hypothetical protein